MTHVDPFLSTTGAGLTCETDSLKVLCVLESGIFPLPLLPLGNWRCDYVRWCVCLCVSLNIITANNKARRRRQGELWPETLSPACVCVCVSVCVVQAQLCLMRVRLNTVCQVSATDRALSKQEIDCLLLYPLSLLCEYYPYFLSLCTFLSSPLICTSIPLASVLAFNLTAAFVRIYYPLVE